MTRECVTCKVIKPLGPGGEFYHTGRAADGATILYRRSCKACVRRVDRGSEGPESAWRTHKVCTGCGENKPVSEFSVRKYRGWVGYYNRCKPCKVAAGKKRLLEGGTTHQANEDKFLAPIDFVRCPDCGLRGHSPGDTDRCIVAQPRSTGLGSQPSDSYATRASRTPTRGGDG